MKFACEQCGRKYVLADEKIAAKEDVRLKCRQCGEVVVIKQAGEMVAKSLATPIPRLPLPEGVVPPPAMPPSKRASGRAGAPPAPSEHGASEPGLEASVPPSDPTEPAEDARADLGTASETPRPASVGRTSVVDGHSETVPETMRASGIGLPRPSLPRLNAKRASAAPPEPSSPAQPSKDAQQPAPKLDASVVEGDSHRPANPAPIVSTAVVAQNYGAPEVRSAAAVSQVGPVLDRLWLGASGAVEKRRMLIALGVGFVLGTVFGLVF
jgi:hypothetical protein